MTITALLSLIKNKYFLIAVLAVCLVISGAITYKTIYKSGYNQGIIYQENIYQKAKDAKDAADKDAAVAAAKIADNTIFFIFFSLNLRKNILAFFSFFMLNILAYYLNYKWKCYA